MIFHRFKFILGPILLLGGARRWIEWAQRPLEGMAEPRRAEPLITHTLIV